MDKLSLKILKYISKQTEPVTKQTIVAIYSQKALASLEDLEKVGFIASQSKSFQSIPGLPQIVPVIDYYGNYVITSMGLGFLEKNPWDVFDRWLTRIIAICGAITGTIALLLELWR